MFSFSARPISVVVTASFLVTGCGGGGTDSHEQHQTTGSVPAGNICLSGNSVLRGSYILPNGEIRRSDFAPEKVLSRNFSNPVIDYSENGSTIAGMRVSGSWVPPNCAAHVFLHYHNDDLSTIGYQLNMMLNESTAPIKLLVVANTPTPPVRPEWQDIAAKAEVVKAVAAQRNVKLCDVNMQSAYNSTDGLHPNDIGYAILSDAIVRCLR